MYRRSLLQLLQASAYKPLTKLLEQPEPVLNPKFQQARHKDQMLASIKRNDYRWCKDSKSLTLALPLLIHVTTYYIFRGKAMTAEIFKSVAWVGVTVIALCDIVNAITWTKGIGLITDVIGLTLTCVAMILGSGLTLTGISGLPGE